ncbi:MAG TPA: amino acid ABC transporter permease [Acidimicrobiales bacterium]|jgi:general L-amino acid transport system permease protein|nr:amino acid ABC transporter permease [Acidimicrobiales bacterium]HJO20686.1 amino acid ABC transporter permease [Acidimicrobiales bacterium]|tara:strand:- start:4853 stop:6655 length:1803 start_codon:yes stop_codon:yes gene_type:complete
MSEMSSGLGVPTIPAPPEEPHLPPRQWIRENLFSSLFNTVLTIVSSLVILAIVRGLLAFIFNPQRQWEATATNLRLLMTQAYPEEQYLRVWVCVAVILTLTAMSMAVWRAGSAVPLPGVGRRLLSGGVLLAIMALLAPFGTRSTFIWLVIAIVVAAGGEALRRFADEERSLSTLALLAMALGGLVATLWVVPYGSHTFNLQRTPRVLAEPGTVAMSTKLPWTLMLVVAVAAYFVGTLVRDRLPTNPLRATLLVTWLLMPPILLYLVLRDPSFDMGHVFTTDIPIFAAYAVLGGALLSWLTRPSTGEAGRIVAALVLVAGFAMFVTPMRMIVRLDMLLLAGFALSAPTFSGGPRARRRYTAGWLGVLGMMSWLITAINTPSTVDVPGEFFIGGISLTLMVAIFTIVISFPLGLALALARTSNMPIFRLLATWFIEFVRGVPLITILIFFSIMVPLFLPPGMHLGEVAAVVIGYSLFSSAYLAENVRGGLQSVTRGQHEAAEAVGMTTSQKTVFIVLPQALRVAIPPLVGHCIGVFKETSLLAIIGLFDVLYIARYVMSNQTEFMGSTKENILFVSLIYWIFAYQMSKASQRLEQRTGLGER